MERKGRLISESQYGQLYGLSIERLPRDPGYVRRERWYPVPGSDYSERETVEGLPESTHVAGSDDWTPVQGEQGHDGERCAWCWLHYAHSEREHQRSIDRWMRQHEMVRSGELPHA